MRKTLLVSCFLIGGCSEPGPAVALSYWATDGAQNHKGVLTIHEHHACSGDVVVFSSSRIPQVGELTGIEPEQVLEYSGSGEIVRRWSVPINRYVQAVVGNAVLLPFAFERSIAISNDGTFEIVETPIQKDEPVNCPSAVLEEMPDSGYPRCHALSIDGEDAVRRIAYEGPCT
jgi:hypothetical protein